MGIHTAIKHRDCEALRQIIRRGGSLEQCKSTNEEEDFEETRTSHAALFLLCEADGEHCPMLKAALSALTQSLDVDRAGFNSTTSICTKMIQETHYYRKSALYVAVEKRNILMVKLLLIHGADPTKCRMSRTRDESCWDDGDDSDDMWYRTSAFAMLKRGNRADAQINALLESKAKLSFEAELMDYYPYVMRQSLSVREALREHFPEEIIHFVIEYFFVVERQQAQARRRHRYSSDEEDY